MGSVLILLTMEKCTQTVRSEKDGHEQRMGKRRDLNKSVVNVFAGTGWSKST